MGLIRNKTCFILLPIFLPLFAWQPASAFDLFYVSVGNTWYRSDSDPLGDSNTSARQVTFALRRAGAVDGITLISERGAYVTPEDVTTTIYEVINRASQADDPLIIFYFMGHGRSEGSTIQHVSVTGSHENANDEDALLPIMSLRSAFEGSGVPHILLMDNCFWRERLDLIMPMALLGGPAVSGETTRKIGSIIGEDVFKAASIVGDTICSATGGRNCASRLNLEIYAAAEGDEKSTVPHPDDTLLFSIGPLARRLLLILDESDGNQTAITVKEFVTLMQDKSIDPLSAAGHVIDITRDNASVLFQAGKPVQVNDLGEIRRGSEG